MLYFVRRYLDIVIGTKTTTLSKKMTRTILRSKVSYPSRVRVMSNNEFNFDLTNTSTSSGDYHLYIGRVVHTDRDNVIISSNKFTNTNVSGKSSRITGIYI